MRAGIDVALRLYDLAELPLLQRSLFGLMAQTSASGAELPSLHVRLMTQRLNFTQIQDVRAAVDVILALDESATLTIHNWDYVVPYDLCAPMLNHALEAAEERYFMTLDLNEQLCPAGLASLLARLAATEAAAATGGIAVQQTLWWGNAFLPIEPARATSEDKTPGPVFVMDRRRVTTKLRFIADSTPTERTNFIEQLRADCVVDEKLSGELMCIREIL